MYKQNPVNYNCPTCKQSGKTPNMGGRFFLINDYECKCNGCDTVYPKEQFYTRIITSGKPLK
jgi:hypothetical protein